MRKLLPCAHKEPHRHDRGPSPHGVLEQLKLQDPDPVYLSNVTADVVCKKDEITDLLARQVSSSVRWQQCVERMLADGVTKFVEIGPGKTLSGFMKRIDGSVKVVSLEKYEDLPAVILFGRGGSSGRGWRYGRYRL